MKHTPGPWNFDAYGEVFHISNNGFVASVYGKTENEANARLIAAAPELLEALRLAEQVLLDEYGPEFTHPHADIIRLAIAKAEGQG